MMTHHTNPQTTLEIDPAVSDAEIEHLLAGAATSSVGAQIFNQYKKGEITYEEYSLRGDVLAMDEDTARRRLEKAQRGPSRSWVGRIGLRR